MDDATDVKDYELLMCERDRIQNEEKIKKLAYTDGTDKGEEAGLQSGFNQAFAKAFLNARFSMRDEVREKLASNK